MTKKQALELYNSGWWKGLNHRDRAMFQLFEEKLCMPFEVFHEAVEKALGRSVWTHEFGLNCQGLQKELLGEQPKPSLQEIFNLIPEEKRIILVQP